MPTMTPKRPKALQQHEGVYTYCTSTNVACAEPHHLAVMVLGRHHVWIRWTLDIQGSPVG
eukprot:107421-Chlamydomonas_euryale.AAC.7